MNITFFASSGTVYTDCEYIKGYAFKNAAMGSNCAILPVICAGLELRQDKCVHFSRIECLSPHNGPA